MKRRVFIGLAALFLSTACVTVRAEVRTTKEAAGGPDCVYVAGNPSWYPVESYNKETKCYEGILPEVLSRVSEKTGLDFVYIHAGKEDQRLRLAKNGQVEMVSGYERDEEELDDYSMTAGRVLFSLPFSENHKNQVCDVCLAFTDIAEPELITKVQEALDEISDRELLEITAGYVAERENRSMPSWIVLGLGAGILALLLVIGFLLRKIKRDREAADKERLFDPITGIGNRAYFVKYFEKYLPDQYRAAYSITYFGFSIEKVNSYYGREGLESQLQYAANELLRSAADTDIVARVSEDGFAVVHLCAGEEDARQWTEELLGRLNRYHEKFEKDFHADFSAGIYMIKQTDRDGETALYYAQQGYEYAVAGEQDYAFCHAGMMKQKNQKEELKKQVFQAIRNQEFKMFLQFIVSAENGEIKGAEALSRWQHPQKGLLNPSVYIEMMEDENTVSELDFYIFEEVCKLLELWQKEGKTIQLSCNFTRITIAQKNFTEHLKEILERHIIDRSRLILEITEDAIETNREQAFENISKCKALGLQIALDDMGSAYTSFSDLRDYPIDIVKIDRSILHSAVSEHGIALLKGMIALAHSLRMQVACEGIETGQQVELLREIGCEYMQGYYFYRAMPKEEAEKLLDERGGNTETQEKK